MIGILRQYYDAVGAEATHVGGTIKDQAGDGVLILVGAPIAMDDHALGAMELAKRIRDRGMALTARWTEQGQKLGVGVGVATGLVTVGVLGAGPRLEYAAVGPAVNLASPLCAEAAHGQVLVDERTREIVGENASYKVVFVGALNLKGYRDPVPSFMLS